jgi:CubicO group peptidase (beta-lactamase class C family)
VVDRRPRTADRRRRTAGPLLVLALIGGTGAACAAGPPGSAEGPATTTAIRSGAAPASAAFETADLAFDGRVAAAGLAGGAAVVGRAGEIVHERTTGDVTRTTPLAVASAAKWLTAATLLTFVDDGVVGLDDPADRWLPELAGDQGAVPTVRQLLTHTAGIGDDDCLWRDREGLDGCARRLARAHRRFPPGSAFAYSNAGYEIAGRLVEVVGGADFASVFHDRLGAPLGLIDTTWPGAPDHPSPPDGLRTTVDDYARFLALLAGEGVHEGRRLLSPTSVHELTRNQVGGVDMTGDAAVAVTGIARYALGAWPDEVDDHGATTVVSGNGGRGFYPWLDRATGTWGVVGVQDDRGSTTAVPASQDVARRYWQAART